MAAAFTVTCASVGTEPSPMQADIDETVAMAEECTAGLTRAFDRLDRKFVANRDRKSAIFGGGFYGTLFVSRALGRASISCFVDSNPHLWGKTILGISVLPPKSLPDDIEVVYVGLNPNRAREIVRAVPALQRSGLELAFLETQS